MGLVLAACTWADNVILVQVVWDPANSWYRWEYVIEVTQDPEARCGTEYTLDGLYDVQAAGVYGSTDWIATFTATSVTWQQVSNCGLVPGQVYPGPGCYLWFAARTNTPTTVNWQRIFGGPPPVQTGTTQGSDEPLDYACVTVWDNWLSFGAIDGRSGSYSAPSPLLADETPASAWPPTASVPGANDYDIAGFRVETTRRLQVSISCGGHLRRCADDGGDFAGHDTRKSVTGPYELATQWKVKFFGKYLTLDADPYYSPTSLQETDYNSWTNWDQVGGDDPAHPSGWLWPSTTDAWSGQALGIGFPSLPGVDLLIERNQYPGGDGEAAELWVTERVLQRGLQDVQGNYRQDFLIHITVAE